MTRSVIRALIPIAVVCSVLWAVALDSMLAGNETAGAAVIGIPAGVAVFVAGAYAAVNLPDPFDHARREGAAEALRDFGNRVATPKEGQDGPTLYGVWHDAMDAAAQLRVSQIDHATGTSAMLSATEHFAAEWERTKRIEAAALRSAADEIERTPEIEDVSLVGVVPWLRWRADIILRDTEDAS